MWGLTKEGEIFEENISISESYAVGKKLVCLRITSYYILS